MNNFLTANYHAHTWRCRHAEGTEREYIEAAIEMGVKTFGFSDHIPFPQGIGYTSRIRMGMEQAEEYVACIRKLAKEYARQIEILVGFEAEYVPDFYIEQMRMFHRLGCDYLIMGQHFFQSEEFGPYTGTPTVEESRIRQYVDEIIEGMSTGSYRYLAHPDIINYQGMDSVYEWEITRLCRKMKELHVPLEINLLGIGEGKYYPCDRFWRIAGEVGNEVILGLDAHSPEHVRDRNSYYKSLDLVDKFNLHLIEKL